MIYYVVFICLNTKIAGKNASVQSLFDDINLLWNRIYYEINDFSLPVVILKFNEVHLQFTYMIY